MAKIKSKSTSKFDLKKFLLHNGGLVGVGVAGFLMLLLALSGAFKLVSAGDPKQNKDELDRRAKALRDGLEKTATPSDGAASILVSGTLDPVDLASVRTTTVLIYPIPVDESKRHPVKVLQPEKAVFDVVKAQVQGPWLTDNGDRIWVVPAEVKGPGGVAPVPAGGPAPPISQRKTVGLTKEELGKEKARMAEIIHPMRMVIVHASFPYKKQLELFQTQLRYSSMEALLKDNTFLPDFRGFIVERRVVGTDKKEPVKWEPVNLEAPYTRMLDMTKTHGFLENDDQKTGDSPEIKKEKKLNRRKVKDFGLLRLQPDEDRLKPVLADGLVYPLPIQFPVPFAREAERPHDGRQPAAPPPLPTRKRPQPDPATPNDDYGFDVISAQGNLGSDNRGFFAAPVIGGPQNQKAIAGRPYPSLGNRLEPFSEANLKKLEEKPGDGGGGFPAAGGAAGPGFKPPDYILMRFIDADNLKPGETYEYSIKIVMVNPNFRRYNQVAWNEVAHKPILESEPWLLPDKVTVPFDEFYYVVDSIVEGNRTVPVLQLHRWLEGLPGRGEEGRVGDWVVAEQVRVNRGEIIPLYGEGRGSGLANREGAVRTRNK